MRYTVIFLLLSACASVPEGPDGTYYGASSSGPGAWGYVQGSSPPAGISCYDAGYPPGVGPPYAAPYNCARPPLFYSSLPYYSYYPVRMSTAYPSRGVHPWRARPLGAGPVTSGVRKASSHRGKRK